MATAAHSSNAITREFAVRAGGGQKRPYGKCEREREESAQEQIGESTSWR